MNESQALEALAALAQETRLRAVRYLIGQGQHGAPAGNVSAALGVSASALSFHLADLKHAGLIDSVRVSRQIVYSANFERLGKLLSYLLEDCCNRHPEVLACCAAGGYLLAELKRATG